MKIDFVRQNLLSSVPNAFRYCTCNGADPNCEACDGAGHIFIAFICLFDCGEGFDTLEELDEHMQKTHGSYPLTTQ